jgi:hypothetical protein
MLIALLGGLVALHPVLSPATATWLQIAEREGESETPSSDETSQEIAPGALATTSASRSRRVAAYQLAAAELSAASTRFAIHAGNRDLNGPSAELAGRNGSGGPLRC